MDEAEVGLKDSVAVNQFLDTLPRAYQNPVVMLRSGPASERTWDAIMKSLLETEMYLKHQDELETDKKPVFMVKEKQPQRPQQQGRQAPMVTPRPV
jgi:hypothetical protein